MLYNFGNWIIGSASELAQLPICDRSSDAPAIRIEFVSPGAATLPVQEWHHRWLDEHEQPQLSMAKLGGEFLLRFPELCDFLIDTENQTIRIAAHCEPATEQLKHLLVDQVLPRVLAQSGNLLVHAGAVCIGDRSVLLIGKSGWGKSTLTALLVRAGHAALSDDCIMLHTVDGQLFAKPSYPSLRLLPDSVANVFPTAAEAAPDNEYVRKQRLQLAAVDDSEGAARVDAIYFLNDPADAARKHTITAHAPAESCIALFQHAFQLDVTDHDRTRALFSKCCDAVRAVPTFVLTYPRDFSQSAALVQLITQHLATLRADARTGTP